MKPETLPDSRWRFAKLLGNFKRIDRLFVVTVAIPTVVAVIYYGAIASDVYISESRFLVRAPQRPIPTGTLGTLLQGAGLARSLDDSYAIHDFILSRDALHALDERLGLSDKFKSKQIDFFNRFNTLDFDESFEGLLRYYQRRVSIDFDTSSSISVLRVSAFTAADAQRINQQLLEMSEHLVNQMSQRSRLDIVGYAETEVREAEDRVKDAAAALAQFRGKRGVMDPERQSSVNFQQVSKLQDELIATKVELAQLGNVAPKNSQIPILVAREAALQREIEAELAKVAGGGGSLTEKAALYERFALEREFSEKQLAAASALLESARSDAQRKQLYLDMVVQPNLPDYAVEPRRVRSIIVVFIAGIIAWGIGSLLIASVKEHFD